jgi:hypothetical protein
VETAAAAARMEQLSMDLGDWSGQVVEDKNPSASGTAGSIQRRYVNRKTGEAVNIYLVCGRPGPSCGRCGPGTSRSSTPSISPRRRS